MTFMILELRNSRARLPAVYLGIMKSDGWQIRPIAGRLERYQLKV